MADAGETVSLWEQGPGWDRSLAAATLATAPVAISGLITIAKTRAPASRSNDQIACTRVGSDPQREIRCRDALRHRARVTAPRPRSQAFLRSSCGHHQAGTEGTTSSDSRQRSCPSPRLPRTVAPGATPGALRMFANTGGKSRGARHLRNPLPRCRCHARARSHPPEPPREIAGICG